MNNYSIVHCENSVTMNWESELFKTSTLKGELKMNISFKYKKAWSECPELHPRQLIFYDFVYLVLNVALYFHIEDDTLKISA